MKIIDYQRPPIRVAVLGLGRAFFTSHYPVFKNHPTLFKIVAACDIIKERRDIIAKDIPDCRMFRQFSDMLDESDVDLVDIATCSVDHVEHAIMSLKKNRWTLLETPIALTLDEAMVLKGAAVKAKNRLLVLQRGMFDPDYLLTKRMLHDRRLGIVNEIRIRKEDYVRRDDWQCVKRLGGGAAYYAMTDLVRQALELLPSPPSQMWNDMKRIASLGDAEDYVRLNLKTRDITSAEIVYNGGCLPPDRGPSFEILGETGTFKVMPGASEGIITCIDPNYKFPRRRASVRTPEIIDMHEEFPVVTDTVRLPVNTKFGPSAFWKAIYDTVRVAKPFPITLDRSIEAVKFAQLMKKNSPFGR